VATGGGAAIDDSSNYLYVNAPTFGTDGKPNGWTAAAAKSSGNANYTLSVYALCAPAS
jgi:hypothetical protein